MLPGLLDFGKRLLLDSTDNVPHTHVDPCASSSDLQESACLTGNVNDNTLTKADSLAYPENNSAMMSASTSTTPILSGCPCPDSSEFKSGAQHPSLRKGRGSRRRLLSATTPAKRSSPHRVSLVPSSSPSSCSTRGSSAGLASTTRMRMDDTAVVPIREVSESERNTTVSAAVPVSSKCALGPPSVTMPSASPTSPAVVPSQTPVLTPARRERVVTRSGTDEKGSQPCGAVGGVRGVSSSGTSMTTYVGHNATQTVVSPSSSGINTMGNVQYRSLIVRGRSSTGGNIARRSSQRPSAVLRPSAAPAVADSANSDDSASPSLRSQKPEEAEVSFREPHDGELISANGVPVNVSDSHSGGMMASCTSLKTKKRKRKKGSTASISHTTMLSTTTTTTTMSSSRAPVIAPPAVLQRRIPDPFAVVDVAKLHLAHRKKRHLRQVARHLTRMLFPMSSSSTAVLYPSQSNTRAPVTMAIQGITADYVTNEEDDNSACRTGARLMAEFIRDHWLLGVDVADRPPASLPYERYLSTPTLDTMRLATPTATTLCFPGTGDRSARSVGGGSTAHLVAPQTILTTTTMIMKPRGETENIGTPCGSARSADGGGIESGGKKLPKASKKRKKKTGGSPSRNEHAPSEAPLRDAMTMSIDEEEEEEEEENVDGDEAGKGKGKEKRAALGVLTTASADCVTASGSPVTSSAVTVMDGLGDSEANGPRSAACRRSPPPPLTASPRDAETSEGTRESGGVTTASNVTPPVLVSPALPVSLTSRQAPPPQRRAAAGVSSLSHKASSLPFTRHSSTPAVLGSSGLLGIPLLPLTSLSARAAEEYTNGPPSSSLSSSSSFVSLLPAGTAGGSAPCTPMGTTPRDARRNLDRLRYIAGGRRALWDGSVAGHDGTAEDEPPLYLYHVIDPRLASEVSQKQGETEDKGRRVEKEKVRIEDVMARPHTYIRWRRVWEEQCRALGLANAPIVNIYVLQQQPSIGFVPSRQKELELTHHEENNDNDSMSDMWITLSEFTSVSEQRKKKKTAVAAPTTDILLPTPRGGGQGAMEKKEKEKKEEEDSLQLRVHPIPGEWDSFFAYLRSIEPDSLYGPHAPLVTRRETQSNAHTSRTSPPVSLLVPPTVISSREDDDDLDDEVVSTTTRETNRNPGSKNRTATTNVAPHTTETSVVGEEGASDYHGTNDDTHNDNGVVDSLDDSNLGRGFGALCLQAARGILARREAEEAEERYAKKGNAHLLEDKEEDAAPFFDVPVEKFAHPLDVRFLSLDDVEAHRRRRQQALRISTGGPLPTGLVADLDSSHSVGSATPPLPPPQRRCCVKKTLCATISAPQEEATPTASSSAYPDAARHLLSAGEGSNQLTPQGAADEGFRIVCELPSAAAAGELHPTERSHHPTASGGAMVVGLVQDMEEEVEEEEDDDGGLSSIAAAHGEEEKVATVITTTTMTMEMATMTPLPSSSSRSRQSTTAVTTTPADDETDEVVRNTHEEEKSAMITNGQDGGDVVCSRSSSECAPGMLPAMEEAPLTGEDWEEDSLDDMNCIQIPVAPLLRTTNIKW